MRMRKTRTSWGTMAIGVAAAMAAATPALAAGSSWGTDHNPEPATVLQSVYVASPTQAWAVGYRSGSLLSPVLEHWDGTAWQKASGVSFKGLGPPGPQLDTVAGTGPDDVWAAGGSPEFGPGIIEHYNGTAWTQVSSPILSGGITSISADSPS